MALPKIISSPIKFSWKIVIILSLLFAISSTSTKFVLGDFGDIVTLIFWLIDLKSRYFYDYVLLKSTNPL